MPATPLDESQLRHPHEHRVFVASVAVNVLIFAAAIALVAYGSAWMEHYPRLAKFATEARAAAIALVLAPPALVFARNTRRASVRGNSVRLGPSQLPEVHAPFERMCGALGVSPAPELYVGQDAIDGYSDAYTAWRSQFVVLAAPILQEKLEEISDVYEFFLGRELGRLRLGHAAWWDELLLAYIVRTPYLRNPLMHVRAYSQDRYALALAPGSIRGLVFHASGRLLLKRLNVQEYLDEARTFRGAWARIANVLHPAPRVALRVRALDEAGFLGRARVAAGPAPAGGLPGAVPGAGTPDAALRPSRST